MKCPFCKSPDTQVIDSRVSDDGESIRRRRKCTSCSKRFTTYETIELRMPQVVKQDGSRSEFDLQKLRTGFMRALHKRPVPTQLVDDAIATITQDVLPFSKTSASRDTRAYGLNTVGLERRGFSKERIRKLHHAYRVLLASKLNTSQALEKLKSEPDRGEDVDRLIQFVESSERGVIK